LGRATINGALGNRGLGTAGTDGKRTENTSIPLGEGDEGGRGEVRLRRLKDEADQGM
jgi:hypothetical protein